MGEKTFDIELKDGKYALKFDNRALYRFEELHGQSATTVMVRDPGSVRAINHFLWAGLLHEHPDLSVADVIDNVDSRRLKEYVDTISQAINAAFDTGEKAEKKK